MLFQSYLPSRIILILLSISLSLLSRAQDDPRSPSPYPDECTSITVGKLASTDGSVITSHTDDSHRTRSWMDIVPAAKHDKGSMVPMYKRKASTEFSMPTYAHIEIGEIPQVANTFGFVNTAYPCMNDQQLAMG
jgi:dipeptidase